MPPQKVPVPDSVRYRIIESLQLGDKVSKTIEKIIKKLPGPPKYIVPHGDLPPGTVSEIVRYRVKVNGWVVVKAHQYRLPDGTIRGPDPKYIRIDEAVFIPMQRPQ